MFQWNGSAVRVLAAGARRRLRLRPRTPTSSRTTWTSSPSASSASSAAAWAPASASSIATWGNLIDDVRTFRADGSHRPPGGELRRRRARLPRRAVHRSRSASRTTGTRRAATPTRAPTGNHFVDNFTALGDYLDAQCRTTVGPDDRHQRRDPVCRGEQRREQDRPPDLRPAAQLQVQRRLRASDRPGQPDRRRADRVHLEAPLRAAAHGQRAGARARRPTRATPRPTSTRSAAASSWMGSRTTSTSRPKRPGASPAPTRPASRPRSSTSTDNQEKTINNNVAWCGTPPTRRARRRSTTSARRARADRSCCRVATASR